MVSATFHQYMLDIIHRTANIIRFFLEITMQLLIPVNKNATFICDVVVWNSFLVLELLSSRPGTSTIVMLISDAKHHGCNAVFRAWWPS
ncbi:jg7556 [Pararge aegeria aegeria]|uniref:Jg7556 protein n=1 Tax=Pararge aegeria aegeria TaxID=348720 RepID=A0A8S4S929_9NEOP|nr:jg7556 [Pararge aegeria aegeria]